MIKRDIKPLNFLGSWITVIDTIPPRFVSPGIYTIEHDTNTVISNTFPNNWSVNLGGQQRLILDGDGDMRITGRMHALGSVMWNQEIGTLQFWDGNIWQNINFNLPPN